MTDFQKRAWVTVDLDALCYNTEQIRKAVHPQTMIMAVVKADAYGHGDRCIAKTLEEQGIVNWFGVSRLEEGLALRDYGITLPILIFGITPPEYAQTLLRYHLVPTVHTLEYGQQLNTALQVLGGTLPIHVKLDTGMSRMGFLSYGEVLEQSLREIETLCQLEHIVPQGLYTHFAVSDTLDTESKDYTEEQFAYYTNVRQKLEERGVVFSINHCSNSAAILHYPEMNLDMVRAGIVLYGLLPAPESSDALDLRPLMNFYGSVTMIKEIPAGRTVSYGREFTAPAPTRIANVGIGYADGYDWAFSNKGEMIIRGQRVPVIGRVCMDQLMLDITTVEDAAIGDIVTVVGTDGEESISFQDLAEATGTIHYEKTSVIGKRVPRVYYRKEEIVDVTDLLRGRSTGFENKTLY